MIFFKTFFEDLIIYTIIVLNTINSDKLEYYLEEMDVPQIIADKARKIIDYPNTGFTYSSGDKTIMFINISESMEEFINTYEHEKNHIEMYLCEKYNINPFSEEASYLSGELAKALYSKLTKTLYANAN